MGDSLLKSSGRLLPLKSSDTMEVHTLSGRLVLYRQPPTDRANTSDSTCTDQPTHIVTLPTSTSGQDDSQPCLDVSNMKTKAEDDPPAKPSVAGNAPLPHSPHSATEDGLCEEGSAEPSLTKSSAHAALYFKSSATGILPAVEQQQNSNHLPPDDSAQGNRKVRASFPLFILPGEVPHCSSLPANQGSFPTNQPSLPTNQIPLPASQLHQEINQSCRSEPALLIPPIKQLDNDDLIPTFSTSDNPPPEGAEREAEMIMVWDSGVGGYVPRCSVPQPKVYIRVVFLKIGEINTLKEQFRAEVFVQARWREPALDNCHNVEDIQWNSLWNPQLQLENAMDDPQTTVWYDLNVSESREAYVLEKRRVKADFCETLELHSFPFDVQHLSVLITSRLNDTCLELLEEDWEMSSVNLLSFVDEQEWDVRDMVESIPEIRSREFSAIKHKFPIITVRTYAIRRAGFFVWNVLAIMVLICSLALCTFAISRKLPQNRLQLSFTLVLTGIAFKFVVGQSLPKISYLTVLDKYILGSMVLMHMVSLWHAVLTRIDDTDPDPLAKTMDDWAFVFFVLVFCLYNIGFAVVMIVKVYMKRKCVHVLETEYRTKFMKSNAAVDRSQQIPKGRIIKKSRLPYNHSKVDTV